MKVLYNDENKVLTFGECELDYNELCYLPTTSLCLVPCFLDCDIEELQFKKGKNDFVSDDKIDIDFLDLPEYMGLRAEHYTEEIFRSIGQYKTQMSLGKEFNQTHKFPVNDMGYTVLYLSMALNTLDVADGVYEILKTEHVSNLLEAFGRDFNDIMNATCVLGMYLQDNIKIER